MINGRSVRIQLAGIKIFRILLYNPVFLHYRSIDFYFYRPCAKVYAGFLSSLAVRKIKPNPVSFFLKDNPFVIRPFRIAGSVRIMKDRI